MRFAGIAIALFISGCFSPGLSSDQFQCVNGLCPEGFRCELGSCVKGAGEPDPDIDAAVVADPPDAAIDGMEVAIDAMPQPTPCYGLPAVQVTLGQIYSDDSSDDNYDNADGCMMGPTAGGDEHYYELVVDEADVPVDLTFDVDGNFDIVLRLRQGICDDEVAEFLCQDTGGDELATRTISVAGSYFIIVDSHNGDNGGAYDLLVTEQ